MSKRQLFSVTLPIPTANIAIWVPEYISLYEVSTEHSS